MPYKDKEKLKAAKKRYYESHKIKREKQHLSSKEIIEKRNQKVKAAYANHIKRDPGYRQYLTEKTKQWQHNHPEKVHLYTQNRINKNKIFIYNYLDTHPCSQCSETDKRILHFHHIRDKKNTISYMIQRHYLERIKEEVIKCIVLCANCHSKIHGIPISIKYLNDKNTGRTAQKRRHRARMMQQIYEYKEKYPCSVCGEKDVRCLVFHHTNPKEKENKIQKLANYSWGRIEVEIKKCIILCQNCHRKLHFISQ